MKILHGTWIPKSGTDFVQSGAFYLWVETDTVIKGNQQPATGNIHRHPQHLAETELKEFLTDSFSISAVNGQHLSEVFSPQYFLLPSYADRPLPSLELARYLEVELPDSIELQYWQIDCYQTVAYTNFQLVSNVVKLLKDIHFLTVNDLTEIQMGGKLFPRNIGKIFNVIVR